MAPHGTASRGLSPSSRDGDTVVGACTRYAPIGSGWAPPEWPAGRPREVPVGLARWTSSGFGPGSGIGRSIAGVPRRGRTFARGWVDSTRVLRSGAVRRAPVVRARRPAEVALDEGVEGAVEHRLGVPHLHPGAVVLDHRVGLEDVRPDLAPPLGGEGLA